MPPKVVSPVPFGATAISPFAPSVILIDPVVEFPVFNVRSLSPLDLKTPAAEPVPEETSPLINTVPSVALDRDSQTKKKADDVLDQFKNRFIFKNKRFSQLGDLKVKNENIKAIIFDLGYSYSQIKDPTKGLSFNSVGDLNMQMGINEFSAKEVVNNLSVVELEKIFKFFGEEKEAKKIASQIEIKRKKKEIDTQCLVELIEKTKKKEILEFIVLLKFFKL